MQVIQRDSDKIIALVINNFNLPVGVWGQSPYRDTPLTVLENLLATSAGNWLTESSAD